MFVDGLLIEGQPDLGPRHEPRHVISLCFTDQEVQAILALRQEAYGLTGRWIVQAPRQIFSYLFGPYEVI